jgi:APA family basic amino acid/polyamine antiporter
MTEGQLQRRLGLTSAVSITVGAVIGSGIFLKPLSIAQSVPSEGAIYVLWVGLGLVCLFGAFAYAELGSMFPEAGGQYAFLREGWGRCVSFLYGWTFFWVINAGTVAGLAIAFAEYLLPLFHVDMDAEKVHPHLKLIVAAAMILFLALINHFGVVIGALLQNVSTFAKVGSLGILVVGGLWVAGGAHAAAAASAAPEDPQTAWTMKGIVTVFTGIFWAYEGWYQLPFNAAELRNPKRDLPLGLVVGMAILITTYTAVNAIYLHVVPFAEMRALTEEQQVAAKTVERVFSAGVASYLTLFVAISVLGSANPNLLSSTRAFYAMAQDGLVPHALTRVSPRWGTPVVSIWSQAVCAFLIVITLQGFHDVTDFVVFAGFIFYALTVGAVYVLRKRLPDRERPYRCIGYPWTPALFIAVAIAFVAAMLRDEEKRKNALYGLEIIAAGGICYLLFLRGRARPAASG